MRWRPILLERGDALLQGDAASDALAARGAEVEGAHPGDGLDTHLGLRGVDRVAAAGADAEGSDALFVHAGWMLRKSNRAADVLDAHGGKLREVRLAAALALVGGVVDQGDEALGGEQFGVGGGDLLLDGAEGWVTTIAGYFVPCWKPAGLNRLPTTVLLLFWKVIPSMSVSLLCRGRGAGRPGGRRARARVLGAHDDLEGLAVVHEEVGDAVARAGPTVSRSRWARGRCNPPQGWRPRRQ